MAINVVRRANIGNPILAKMMQTTGVQGGSDAGSLMLGGLSADNLVRALTQVAGTQRPQVQPKPTQPRPQTGSPNGGNKPQGQPANGGSANLVQSLINKGSSGNKVGTDSVTSGDGDSRAGQMVAGVAKSRGLGALQSMLAAGLQGAPTGALAKVGLGAMLSPVGLAKSVADAISRNYTDRTVMENLATPVAEMLGVTGDVPGFHTNPWGAFGIPASLQDGDKAYSAGFTDAEGNPTGSQVTQAEMTADSPNKVFGTTVPGNPQAVDAMIAEQQAAAILSSILAAAGGNGTQGGATNSQTSATAMSNPNNTQSPAQFGGHSGFTSWGGGGGGNGGTGGQGNNSQTSASAMSNSNNTNSPAGFGGHSGYGR